MLTYEDSENIKTDRVNTFVFNLHQVKRQTFFGTPGSSWLKKKNIQIFAGWPRFPIMGPPIAPLIHVFTPYFGRIHVVTLVEVLFSRARTSCCSLLDLIVP